MRTPVLAGVACVWMIVGLAQGQSTAPAPAPGERIVGVRLVGSTTISADAVLYYLGIHVGDPLDEKKIRKNFDALWRSGLFDDIAIEVEHGPGGATLVFTVTERPTITSVEYTGNKKLSLSQIHDKVSQEKAGIKVGAPLSLKDVAAVIQAIKDIYLEGGFRSVSVDWRLEGTARTQRKLVFAIDEGEKIKIAAIHFKGNTIFTEARIRLAMKKTKIDTLWRLLSDNTVYNQANFDEDVESIRHLYQDYGYKDVVVKDPVLDIYVSNPAQKNPKKRKKKVRITIPLVEGERFYFGKIDIVTDDGEPKVFAKAKLLHHFRYCKVGDVLSRERMTEALSGVESDYKKKGYIYWFADPVFQTPTKDHRVDINIKTFEGDPFTLGRVEFEGNTGTRDKVLRRQLAIDEGDVLDMEAFKKSVLKISQLGFFKLEQDPSFVPDNTNKRVDVTIKGVESSRNELNFGAGYSGFDGFFAQFSFSTRNFLGTGDILSASVQLGKITTSYDLGYTIPWFMDKNQTIGASIYDRESTYLEIDDRRKGISLVYGRGLGIFDAYSISYGVEKIHSLYPVQSAPVPPGFPIPPLASSLVEGTTSGITPQYRYDSTDDPFDPSSGHRATIGMEFAGLGGTNYFLKPTASLTEYIPVGRTRYLGFHIEGAAIVPYGGHHIAIYERYQLGGEQTIRGYPIGSIVPLSSTHRIFVDEQGRILGGDKYALANLEFIFAKVGPVKLLAFGDAGNTWIRGQDVSLADLKTSVGLEMRLLLPIFQAPLRFIYSWNLHPIEPLNQFGFPISVLNEKHSGFDFSIGSTF